MEGGGGSRRLTSFRRCCSRWRSFPRHRPRCRCQSTDLEQNTPEWVQRVLVSVSSAAAASGVHGGGAEHTKVPLGWLKRDKVPSSVAVCALQSVHATDSGSSRLLWCHDDVINYLIQEHCSEGSIFQVFKYCFFPGVWSRERKKIHKKITFHSV